MRLSLKNCIAKLRGDNNKEKNIKWGMCLRCTSTFSALISKGMYGSQQGEYELWSEGFYVPVVVWLTDASKQSGLTSRNEKCQHSPGADKLEDEAVFGGDFTRTSHIDPLDQVTPQENTASGPWDNHDTREDSQGKALQLVFNALVPGSRSVGTIEKAGAGQAGSGPAPVFGSSTKSLEQAINALAANR